MPGQKELISWYRLVQVLHYDPYTGAFTWLEPPPHSKKGDHAENRHVRGYYTVKVFGFTYYAHRLAWFYMTKEWPPKSVDHKNRIFDDNRWINLRICNQAQNCANSKLNAKNTSGVPGVSYRKDDKTWQAYIGGKKNKQYIGSSKNFDEAVRMRIDAARKRYGEFSPHE